MHYVYGMSKADLASRRGPAQFVTCAWHVEKLNYERKIRAYIELCLYIIGTVGQSDIQCSDSGPLTPIIQ